MLRRNESVRDTNFVLSVCCSKYAMLHPKCVDAYSSVRGALGQLRFTSLTNLLTDSINLSVSSSERLSDVGSPILQTRPRYHTSLRTVGASISAQTSTAPNLTNDYTNSTTDAPYKHLPDCLVRRENTNRNLTTEAPVHPSHSSNRHKHSIRRTLLCGSKTKEHDYRFTP